VKQVVKISVVGGVAFVDEVPPGVLVQVTDYDVDRAQATDVDEQGVCCSRYRVDAECLERS
jgi:hypothetical protein